MLHRIWFGQTHDKTCLFSFPLPEPRIINRFLVFSMWFFVWQDNDVNDPFWEVISDKMKIAQYPSCLSFIVPPNLKERRAICLHANIFGSDMIPRTASVRLSIQMYKKAHPYYQTILERKEDWGHGEA